MMFRVCVAVFALAPAGALALDPASVLAPNLKPGDSWVFDRAIKHGTSGFSDQRFDFKVESVGVDTMVVGIKLDGALGDFEAQLIGADWSQRRLVDGEQTTTGRPFSFPLSIGKTWTSDYVDLNQHGLQVSAQHHDTYTVVGWEDMTTPAGTFHAIKITADDNVKGQFMASSATVGGAVATSDGSSVVARSGRTGLHMEMGNSCRLSGMFRR